MNLFKYIMAFLILSACRSPESGQENNGGSQAGNSRDSVKLITLAPGHFHASLVQKYSYDMIDSVVHVYAPEGPEVQNYLNKIEQFNNREEDPTNWVEKVYTGPDYLEKMLEDKPGNVMVVAGNNARKMDYVLQAVKNGIHVYADKPMTINEEDFEQLKEAFKIAEEKDLLIYDIMTERYEVATILQKELSQMPEIFGTLEKGSPENPAITKESVHHYYKQVAGQPLVRPAWFFDMDQQGEAIVGVSTHLVDLVLWECFPEEILDYQKENPEVVSARSWPNELTPAQFTKVTQIDAYPDYLKKNVVDDSILTVNQNGEFVFKLRGVYAKVSVKWNFQAPEGGGDTHYSIMRGSKADLVIRQNEAQDYKPTLYVEPKGSNDNASFGETLKSGLEKLSDRYPGLTITKTDQLGWQINIPDKFRVGHEEHFAQVTEKFLEYFKQGELPEWEKQYLLTKQYITTQAYKKSR